MDFGFRLHQLATIEGKEIIGAEVCLGHFGEELLLVGEPVVRDALTGDLQAIIAMAACLEFPIGCENSRLIETENLVMIGVCEFV